MAKVVEVKLKQDSDWQEVEVANFYDPTKHHTVRLKGDAKKTPYAFMKMPNGSVYDKAKEEYVKKEKPETVVNIDKTDNLLCLPYGDNSVKELSIIMKLQLLEKKDVIPAIKEAYRVLSKMGKLIIEVPYYPNIDAISNPTYLTLFTQHTFNYFLDNPFKNFNQTVTTDRLKVTFYK